VPCLFFLVFRPRETGDIRPIVDGRCGAWSRGSVGRSWTLRAVEPVAPTRSAVNGVGADVAAATGYDAGCTAEKFLAVVTIGGG
jgi:hypothetical protein